MHAERRGIPLHTKIFIGLILGAIVGVVIHFMFLGPGASLSADEKKNLTDFLDNYVAPVGKVFLYLIFMVVVPLLLSALVLGVQELGQAGKMGRVGFRALFLTILLSGIAVVIGLAAVNLVKPGDQLSQEKKTEILAKASKEKGEEQLKKAQDKKEDPPLLGFIPQNPLKEAVRALDGGLLAFMFFALIFGLALAYIEPEKALPVVAVFEGLFAMSLKVIEWALALAPFGVFFLLASSIAKLGWELLGALVVYAAVVLGALAIHQFVVYSFFLKTVAKRNPMEFFRQIKAVMLTAFATASSNATLPLALKSAEQDVGLPRDISSFVLTVGATANQNGTALFEGVTILFLAQLYNVPLDLMQQLSIMGLAIVAGIGTAGVPGGSLPFVAAVMAMYNIPIEGIGIILGIDRILDMSRTVLNVTGDMTIAACVSTMEGQRQAPVGELAET
jgi:dicarboxylate/amino acid:cation (Na+ or H+) symporter, DAACS family